jgi:hypothetical protein
VNSSTPVEAAVFRFSTSLRDEDLRRLFDDVALDEGWTPGRYLQDCAERSLFVGVSAENARIAGLQLVLEDPSAPLPLLAVWPEIADQVHWRAAEVAVLAVRAPHRGSRRLLWFLAAEVWRVCQMRSISEIWLAATERRVRQYRLLGWPLEVKGGLRRHWGEDCLPCRVRVADAEAYVRRRVGKEECFRSIVSWANREPFPPTTPTGGRVR